MRFDQVVTNCRLLCELLQLQSAILESSITKHVTHKYEIDKTEVMRTYLYGDKNSHFIDNEDSYRLRYIQKKSVALIQSLIP